MKWHGKHNGTTLMGALHYLVVTSMGLEGLLSHRYHIDVSLFFQWRDRDSVGLTVDSIRRDGLLHDVERSLEPFYDGAIILK
jgi:hypothetical protein